MAQSQRCNRASHVRWQTFKRARSLRRPVMLNCCSNSHLRSNQGNGSKPISIGATTFRLALMASFLFTLGCYPDWPEHSGTAQVEGEVFLDGFPLNKANIVFLPSKLKSKSGKLMKLAYGKCDARGKFKMAYSCLLYTSPSPRDQRGSRMPSSA